MIVWSISNIYLAVCRFSRVSQGSEKRFGTRKRSWKQRIESLAGVIVSVGLTRPSQRIQNPSTDTYDSREANRIEQTTCWSRIVVVVRERIIENRPVLRFRAGASTNGYEVRPCDVAAPPFCEDSWIHPATNNNGPSRAVTHLIEEETALRFDRLWLRFHHRGKGAGAGGRGLEEVWHIQHFHVDRFDLGDFA